MINGNKRPRLDQPAGVGALGYFRRISSNDVDLILERVRANPSCLQQGPQSYKMLSQRNREKLKADIGITLEVPLKKGSTFSWGILHPARLLQHYCRISKSYRDLVKKARERYPGKWHLILYEDEIQPGNAFLGRRKLHAWYFTFREFDQQIRDENAWVCFAVSHGRGHPHHAAVKNMYIDILRSTAINIYIYIIDTSLYIYLIKYL